MVTALRHEKGTKVRDSSVFFFFNKFFFKIKFFIFIFIEVCCETYFYIINFKRHVIKPIVS